MSPAAEVPSDPVIDVTDATFPAEVVERSRQLPVVVDFWAPWCGPCQVLGPVLERQAREHAGELVLAKVNTDTSPQAAAALGVRGIPAVKAFRDGRVVAELTGARPEAEVRAFLQALLPTEADRLATGGAAARERGELGLAEQRFRAALAAHPGHPEATLGLVQVLAATKREAEGRELVATLGEGTAERRRAEAELARLRWQSAAREAGDLDDLRSRAAAGTLEAEGLLRLAGALAGQGEAEGAARHLVAALPRLPAPERDRVRQEVLHLFEALGPESDAVRDLRQRLAAALY